MRTAAKMRILLHTAFRVHSRPCTKDPGQQIGQEPSRGRTHRRVEKTTGARSAAVLQKRTALPVLLQAPHPAAAVISIAGRIGRTCIQKNLSVAGSGSWDVTWKIAARHKGVYCAEQRLRAFGQRRQRNDPVHFFETLFPEDPRHVVRKSAKI